MSAKHAYAESTNKNIRTQWESYYMFCIYFKLKPLPTTVSIMSIYAQFLSRSFKSVEAINNYISGVKLLHLYLDIEYPQFDSFHLKLVLKGLARLNPHCPNQANPITPSMLYDMSKNFDTNSPIDSTFWCLFLHAFFLMFRKSNLVPDSVTAFNSSKQLCRDNYEFDEEKGVLLVKINWSKTIQFGEREIVIPLVPIPNSPLCPVKAYLNMISLTVVSGKNPAFCIKTGKIIKPVTYKQLQSVLKHMVASIGKDASKFSSHSFRRGGCSWAFSANVPTELIQLYGDWKSEAYKKYLKFDLEDKILVAKSMNEHILKRLMV